MILPDCDQQVDLMPATGSADDEELLLKLPTSFQEAQAVKATLALYKENCSGLVIALMVSFYLFMQVTLCTHNVTRDVVHLPVVHVSSWSQLCCPEFGSIM